MSYQEFSAEDLSRHAVERRAIEAVIWGMPAVNYQLMYSEMVRKVDGGFNQVLCWSRLLDWKNQTLNAEPRRDLSDAVLQHEGRRSGGAGDSAGR